jgi:RNA polymerase sigma-70 factor, ECF subfamily
MTIDDLYDQYETQLRAYGAKLAGDPDLADDLVQETFIRCMGHLQLLEALNRHQRRGWLCQTLKNLFLDRQSARQREQALMARLCMEMDTVTAPEHSSLGPDVFDLVPDSDRQLLEKRYRQGLTSREIAAELGVPAATVRSRLHLVVKRLRARKSKFARAFPV